MRHAARLHVRRVARRHDDHPDPRVGGAAARQGDDSAHAEAELRRVLREMRTAIDKFKDAADAGMIPTTELKANSEGYPPDLETLVDGVSVANDATGRKLKFLRRIPSIR